MIVTQRTVDLGPVEEIDEIGTAELQFLDSNYIFNEIKPHTETSNGGPPTLFFRMRYTCVGAVKGQAFFLQKSGTHLPLRQNTQTLLSTLEARYITSSR